MKKTELKQLIKETISSMGYVDAKMERPELSEDAVNYLMGGKKMVKEVEELNKTYSHEEVISLLISFYYETMRGMMAPYQMPDRKDIVKKVNSFLSK